MFGSLCDIPIRVNEWLDCTESVFVQFRFPRSRKRRIRNKWKKRRCNWRCEKRKREHVVIVDHAAFSSDGLGGKVIYVPSMDAAKQLVDKFNRQANRSE